MVVAPNGNVKISILEEELLWINEDPWIFNIVFRGQNYLFEISNVVWWKLLKFQIFTLLILSNMHKSFQQSRNKNLASSSLLEGKTTKPRTTKWKKHLDPKTKTTPLYIFITLDLIICTYRWRGKKRGGCSQWCKTTTKWWFRLMRPKQDSIIKKKRHGFLSSIYIPSNLLMVALLKQTYNNTSK
jgi:hypothetical protein